MSDRFTEADVEEVALGWVKMQGHELLLGPQVAPGEPAAERETYRQVALEQRLHKALKGLNRRCRRTHSTTLTASSRGPICRRAVQDLGDHTLRLIARKLLRAVRRNVTIDLAIREIVRANMRLMIQGILRSTATLRTSKPAQRS